MTKLKGDIFKGHSDKLGLLWTIDQWQAVMDAMYEYAQQEVRNIVIQADVSSCFCVVDDETGYYESIHKTVESAEKEIADWKKFRPSKDVRIVERGFH